MSAAQMRVTFMVLGAFLIFVGACLNALMVALLGCVPMMMAAFAIALQRETRPGQHATEPRQTPRVR